MASGEHPQKGALPGEVVVARDQYEILVEQRVFENCKPRIQKWARSKFSWLIGIWSGVAVLSLVAAFVGLRQFALGEAKEAVNRLVKENVYQDVAAEVAKNGTFKTTFSQTIFPVGTILAFGGPETRAKPGDNVPGGWVPCDGRALKRETYPKLFAAIGVRWGEGDLNGDTFTVPDLRGYFLRGATEDSSRDPDWEQRMDLSGTATRTGGVGSYQEGELGEHKHVIASTQAYFDASGREYMAKQRMEPVGTSTYTTNPSGGSETRPKNAYVLFIIKAE